MTRLILSALLVFIGALARPAWALTFVMTPASPTTTDPISITAYSGCSDAYFSVVREGNKLIIPLPTVSGICFSTPSQQTIPIGVLPAGAYVLDNRREGTVKPFTVTQAPVVVPAFNSLDGVWGNVDQPGRALYLGQTETGMAGGWLVPGPGGANWYLLQGTWTSQYVFKGSLLLVSGSSVDVPFDAKATVLNHVGTLNITFLSAESAVISWAFISLGFPVAQSPTTLTKFKFR